MVEAIMQLPLIYFGEPTAREIEVLHTFSDYPPRTKLKPGDLGFMHERYRQHLGVSPWFWQVRFVISRWQMEMHELLQHHPHLEVNALSDRTNLLPHQRTTPVIYAHGFPHAYYPNSARWVSEVHLRQLVLRGPTPEWESVLDQFQVPFLGYDQQAFGASFTLELAPDRYGVGQPLKQPLQEEQPTFHSMLLLGLHPTAPVPQEHDAYVASNSI